MLVSFLAFLQLCVTHLVSMERVLLMAPVVARAATLVLGVTALIMHDRVTSTPVPVGKRVRYWLDHTCALPTVARTPQLQPHLSVVLEVN